MSEDEIEKLLNEIEDNEDSFSDDDEEIVHSSMKDYKDLWS